LCLTGPASAATYSVATSGNDGSDGISSPFRTFQKAASALHGGDTIVLSSGTYTAGAQVTHRNVTIRGAGTVIRDEWSTSRIDGLTIYQSSGITLDNLTFSRC